VRDMQDAPVNAQSWWRAGAHAVAKGGNIVQCGLDEKPKRVRLALLSG
jgi:hypothetical protein